MLTGSQINTVIHVSQDGIVRSASKPFQDSKFNVSLLWKDESKYCFATKNAYVRIENIINALNMFFIFMPND